MTRRAIAFSWPNNNNNQINKENTTCFTVLVELRPLYIITLPHNLLAILLPLLQSILNSLILNSSSSLSARISRFQDRGELKSFYAMIPRAPSLFHIEDGAVGVAASTKKPMPADSGELVGLRLIIQQSPRQRPPLSVLRRSAVRPSPAATAAASQDEAGAPAGRGFMGLGFLNCCYCCHKKLYADMDVFVYK